MITGDMHKIDRQSDIVNLSLRKSPSNFETECVHTGMFFYTADAALCLYMTLHSAIFPKIAFKFGGPQSKHGSLDPLTHHPKRHLDRFRRFSTIHARYQRTHRQNDNGTRPVRLGR